MSKIDAPEEKKVVLGCLESFSAELSKLEEFRKSVEGKDALYSVEQKNQSKFYLPSEIGKVSNPIRTSACIRSSSSLYSK